MALGRRVFGAGVVWLGVVCLASRDFLPGEPVAAGFPGRALLALLAGVFLIIAGMALQWGRTLAPSSAALTVYYLVVVLVLMNGRSLLMDRAYGTYSSNAEQLGLAVGSVLIFVDSGIRGAVLKSRLRVAGRVVFGVCAVLWGGAHFRYMNLTAPLVPKWLPPSGVFWGYVTGVYFVVAGVALISGIKARLAAVSLTVMLAVFALLVHWPSLFTNHSNYNWSEAALNFALMGAAWVVADSLRSRGG